MSGVTIATTPGDCVDVSLAPSASACSTDAECTTIKVGNFCPGPSTSSDVGPRYGYDFGCGTTGVSRTAHAAFLSMTSGLSVVFDDCAVPSAHCVAGACVACPPGGCVIDAGAQHD
jgi:hypothetical protein